jgi:hypothetical protein
LDPTGSIGSHWIDWIPLDRWKTPLDLIPNLMYDRIMVDRKGSEMAYDENILSDLHKDA